MSVSEYFGVAPRKNIVDEGDFLSRAETLEGYKKCATNDLVMNIMLAWKTGLGISKYEGIVSPAYSVFRLLNKKNNPDFLNYLLRDKTYVAEYKRWSYGIIESRLRLYPDTFFTIPILLPPDSHQAKIAEFMNYDIKNIDSLITKQEVAIELLKEKRSALITRQSPRASTRTCR